MTTTASLWLVYHLSDNPFYVGLVGFANQFPVLVLAPFAGVWVDRLDGLRVVRFTQALSMAQSVALAVLALSGHMTVPWLIGLCLCQGFINALDWPARQALNPRLAGDRALLNNVIALNSITFNVARLTGPAIAGFVIAAVGPGWCFALDAASFCAVLASLFAVRLAPRTTAPSAAHPLADLRDGVRYAFSHPPIRRVLLMVPAISLAGFAHSILAPVFARDVFHGDARLLGFLLSATGLGSIGAGLFLSTRQSPEGLERAVAWGAAIGGLGLAGIALSPWLPLALVCFAAAGVGSVLVMATSNTLLQTAVTDDKRGRVMGLFTMGQSMFPLGSLIAGAAAAAWSAPTAMLGCSAICLCAALVFARHLQR